MECLLLSIGGPIKPLPMAAYIWGKKSEKFSEQEQATPIRIEAFHHSGDFFRERE